jgi:alkylhydroperoxidase/carboxymuconolactone decarboxylase family protein YurZ
LELDPDVFEAYTQFSAVPFRHLGSEGEGEDPAGRASRTGTGLSPKVKEFVYIAIDCATTYLYVSGLKLHIRNAVRMGATLEEVTEGFDLVSSNRVQSVMVGLRGWLKR